MKYRVRMAVMVDVEARSTSDAISQVGGALRQGVDSVNEDSEYDFEGFHVDEVHAYIPRKCLDGNCTRPRRFDTDYCDGHSR